MLRDLRFAVRMLFKQPGFTVITVLTLALGIGATSAVFSLIQGVLLTPPPYREPQRLVLITAARGDGKQMTGSRGWPAQQWLVWQTQAKSFEAIGAYGWTFNFLVRDEGSESMEGMWVTTDYFRAIGVQPMLGRTFVESEARPGATAVIILGYNLWQRKFNGDPHIVGTTIRMSRRKTPVTVIGVMPPGVRFLPSPGVAKEPNYDPNAMVDFWVPAAPDPKQLKDPYWNVVARLRGGTPVSQAQQELGLIVAREAQAEHDFEGITARVQSLASELNRDGGRILFPLLGAAGLVLLIACGNAAALLLVRGLQRQQEYAVRSALGVGRVALFRQVSIESLLLAAGGGVLGAALAFGVVKLFKLIGGHAIPRLDSVTAGWPLIAWGLGAAVFSALLAGMFPALRASRFDPIQVLKSAGPNSSAGRGERRILRGVTMAQTALTLALLVGAGLLIRTMSNIAKVQSGYDVEHILTISVTAVQGNWRNFHQRALERVAALPGVKAVAFAWGVPLTGNNWPDHVDIEGQARAAKDSDRIQIALRAATTGYFELMGLAIREGRDFRTSDAHERPSVAIVNQALADRYFAKQNAIGKKIWFGWGQPPPAVEIIGVVSNGRTDDLTQAAEPEIYLSLWEATAFSKHLVVRTAADPRSVVAAVERELRSVDPTAAVENVKTLKQIRGDSLASRTFAMELLAGFSVVGSVLTLVGIYGVLSLSVASRKRELAIRTALGAERRDIQRLVFGEGFRLIAGGVIAGIVAAVLLSRVLKTFLFDVKPTDPVTLIAVGLMFAMVASLACWAPTRRAGRVNPLEALRYE
jgi:putative ABC transport system permease protein